LDFNPGFSYIVLRLIPMKKETKSRISTKKNVAERSRKLNVFSTEHERFYFIFGLEDNVYDEKIPPRVPTLARIWKRLRGIVMHLTSLVNYLPL
jgi:hypothetical protein